MDSRYATINRNDPALLALIASHGIESVNGLRSHLAVVEIPDETTDWQVFTTDGFESLIYVVDGKLKILK